MGIIGGIGVPELVIILLVVLVIFGPKNLPKLGASLGKTVKNIRAGMSEDDKEDKKKIEDVEVVDEEDADVVEEETTDEDADAEAAPKKKAPAKKRTAAKKADADAE